MAAANVFLFLWYILAYEGLFEGRRMPSGTSGPFPVTTNRNHGDQSDLYDYQNNSVSQATNDGETVSDYCY